MVKSMQNAHVALTRNNRQCRINGSSAFARANALLEKSIQQNFSGATARSRRAAAFNGELLETPDGTII
jgi:hypothetical protein